MKLFANATLKLAGWYLIILMTVSLLFSVIVFQVARSEVESRIARILEQRDPAVQYLLHTPDKPEDQLNTATTNLLISLMYINITVLLAGGAGAYLLAKHTLKPIEEAHKVQSRFVANASHQLRTPLAIIKAETELALRDNQTSKDELKQTLSSNLEEINHLSELSSMLLELSRSERKLKHNNLEVDIAHEVQDIITLRKITSRTVINSLDSIKLTSNKVAVREIINILIDNAIKHSPPKSTIRIELSQNKQLTTVNIINRGSGITKKQISHIFESFYKSNKSEGYGLGLPLAKQLTLAVNGTLTVTSDLNKKTIFTLILPNK